MGSRSRFRPRLGRDEPIRDRGTKQRRLCGGPFKRVGREAETGVRGGGATQAQALWSRHARKAGRGATRASVPETDTGGRGEYPQALGRTLAKELGKMTP